MRNILLVVGAATLVGLFSACGGSDHAAVPTDSTGGKGTGGNRPTTGGKSAEGGAGGADDSDNTDPLGPIVIITSPEESSDPNKDGVLSGNEVTVTCSAVQSRAFGAGKVNTASVELGILDSAGKLLEKKPGVPTATANEYSAKFGLSGVPAGVVSFTCTAEDINMHPGADGLKTFLDKGPLITIIKPAADSAHPITEPLDIEFTVEAAPLGDKDPNAEVDFDSVKLSLVGQPIDLADANDKPGHYRLQVNLADPKLFNPAPSGPVPLVLEATNQRSPEGVTATANEDVLVDGAGPVIQITSPGDKAVVGGKVRLSFTVTDTVSGVDPKTISVALNMVGNDYKPELDSWSFVNNVYTFEFDSRLVQNAKVQITVNVGATDKVGNVSTGASELLYLDNYPPVLDLDPLNIRTNTDLPDMKCSSSFDPLGNAAVNDLDQVAIAGFFRSLVVDQTNAVDEIPIKHFAGTNPKSVRLYIEGNNAKPLLVDTDGDGICDDVAEVDSTTSLDFMPIPKDGAPRYIDDAGVTAPAVDPNVCPTKDERPLPLGVCDNHVSDMWQVIQDEVNKSPVIYGASVTSGLECTGVPWEFSGKLDSDGWVCAVTRAVDNVGNVGVSRPIRICLDDPDRDTIPACASASVDASDIPSCTDGCTPSQRLGGDVWPWR